MNEYYTVEMVRHFQKAVAKSNEIDERLKHRPRATKWSANRFYNFKRKKGKVK